MTEKEYTETVIREPVRRLETYAFNAKRPLHERIASPPALLLQTLAAWHGVARYTPYTPSKEETRIIAEAFSRLPSFYETTLRTRLIAVYFLDDYPLRGTLGFVYDTRKRIYAYIALPASILASDLSSWLTRLEKSIFTGDAHVSVRAGNAPALLYPLLHYGARILDANERLTPYTDPFHATFAPPATTGPFTRAAWKEFSVPFQHFNYAKRMYAAVAPLERARLSPTNAYALYTALTNTPFVSLYGAVDWGKDFAEALTFYHLTKEEGTTYEIAVEYEGEAHRIRPLESAYAKPRLQSIARLY